MPFFFNNNYRNNNQQVNKNANFGFFNNHQNMRNNQKQTQQTINPQPNLFSNKNTDFSNGIKIPQPTIPQQMENNMDIQQGSTNFQPLTPEQMEKIQEEIKVNKEKMLKGDLPLIHKEDTNNDIKNISNAYLKGFIQSGQNSIEFYKKMSILAMDGYDKDKILAIIDDCIQEEKFYLDFYSNLNSEEFIHEKKDINFNINYSQGLNWAVEEELSEYEKICDFIEERQKLNISKNSNELYANALKKLKRIGLLQYLVIKNKS